jgi:hypothetical protein
MLILGMSFELCRMQLHGYNECGECDVHEIKSRNPGENVGRWPELDSSGCAFNVIICVGIALSWTRVFLEGCQYTLHQTAGNRSIPVNSISLAYIVKYVMSLSDGNWNHLVQTVPGVLYCFQ